MQNEPVIVERTYPAPIEKVWQAITDPEQMRQWYFPTLKDFKPVVGFETEFDVVHNNKHFPHIWKVTEVIPGRKICYEWKFAGYPGTSLLKMELFENSKGTRLVLTHEGIENFRGDMYPDLSKQNFVQGWTGFIGTYLKDYLEKTAGPTGETGMLIRKPVADVFEAFIDPAITTKFWFTQSSGRLQQGQTVKWTWEMYDHVANVLVKDIVENKTIEIEWGTNEEDKTGVEWTFEPLGAHSFVQIKMYGFKGDQEAILKQVGDSVGGFCWVLAGLKAYLEHGIQLNLIADRFPKGKND